jgi:hypothetical protein
MHRLAINPDRQMRILCALPTGWTNNSRSPPQITIGLLIKKRDYQQIQQPIGRLDYPFGLATET